MIKKNEIKLIEAYLKKKLKGVIFSYIYGSQSTKESSRQSDVDIAVYGKSKYGALELWNHAQSLASQLRKDVDLVDLRTVSTVFRFQVISTGQQLFSREPFESGKFEDLAYSQYIRFNEERKLIMDEIRKRGKVYR